MTTSMLQGLTVDLAVESGLQLEEVPGEVRLVESETSYVVGHTERGWLLTRRFRNHEPVVEAVSDLLEGVEPVLVSKLGQAWRTQAGLPALVTVRRGRPTPGAMLEEDATGRWTVRWDGGRRRVTDLNVVSAATLLRMAVVLDDADQFVKIEVLLGRGLLK